MTIVQMLRFLFISIVLISFTTLSWSQTGKPTKLYARPYRDSIALRWHPYDTQLWERNIKRGYDVYRKTETGLPVKINKDSVKALNPTQFAKRYLTLPPNIDTTQKVDWDTYVYPDIEKEKLYKYKPDSIAMKAMILQFPKEVGFDDAIPQYKEGDLLDFGTDKLQIRWLFHSLVCLSSKEAAIVSGLYFMDKNVDRKQRYTYYITTAGESWQKALATITVSPEDPYPIHAPTGLGDFTNKRRSVVNWKKADTVNVYIPVYDIYRSEKINGPYVKINKKEIYGVYTGTNQRDSTIVTYSDSTLEKGKVYFYKVQGLDVFGDHTELSKPWKVTEKTYLSRAPFIDEAKKLTNPLSTSVKWKVDDQEVENISFFRIYRSKKPDTLFVPVSENLKKDQRVYIDKVPTKDNYYKVMTVGNAGDTLWTSPAYVLIPDSIPPLAPTMLKAICDSNGIVTLKWKHNNEQDLHSFKLYRANYKHEEFSRVATIERVDTTYKDTISLATLTESVFYKIIAYDDSYNPSEFSNVIQAKRYDTIAPTHPVFTDLRSDTAGIKLVWANSSSEDVIKTVLYRKLKGETSWHEYKTFAKDTSRYTTFIDRNNFKGQWYEYALQSFDDDKNVSGFSPVVQLRSFDDGFRPEIKNITSKVDVRKGIVKISWKYDEPGVKVFQVFRATNDKPLMILQSVDPGVYEFYDKEVSSGNKYKYQIRAVFNDGGMTPFSKEIVVEMK